jgi:hypothetical protein
MPQIDYIGNEEFVSSAVMERPNVSTDSKAQPHFICDFPGGGVQFSKYSKVNGVWRGGVFAQGTPRGRYSASRLYVGQISIDSKDRSWISCKFGCKEFGSMLGQGIWLFRDVATNPKPPEQFFRHVNVYKGMGAVSIDNKYVDHGVVMGTLGNYMILDHYGKVLGAGTLNAGPGGEKVRSTIASYAPRYRPKDDTKAYPDGIWHTAMNGSRKGSAAYQSSTRHKAGLGYVVWADYESFSEMGGDFIHPGIGTDSTDPRYCYIASVFRNSLRMNIWDGTRMLFPTTSLKTIAYDANTEVRHAPSVISAPANMPGVFVFWISRGRIKMVYVSKKGDIGKITDVSAGRSPAAATDRYGNIHLVYYNNGIKYRKINISILNPITPKGRVTTTRTPQFRWTDTKADSYTVEITRDGVKAITKTVSDHLWTPALPLEVGDYSWRVKEGNAGSSSKWSQSASFELPPLMPQQIGPEQRFDSAVTPTFEWSNIDPATTRYKIELFKAGDSLGTRNATGDVKNGLLSLTAKWTGSLDAGLYSWRIQAQRHNADFPVYSDWTKQMAFQVLVPGPTAIVQPGSRDTFAPGNGTIACNWTPAEGATAYKLKVVYNGSTLDTYAGITDTNFPMTRFFQPGYHTLLVQPQNASGNGPWSAPLTVLVRRLMKPANAIILDQAPAKLTWTRTKEASRYLAKLSQYNPKTQSYILIAQRWMTQSVAGEDPIWKPNFGFPAGAYRWSVTDYFDKKQGFTSVAYFQVKVPGMPDSITPLGTVDGHRSLQFVWTDPSDGAKEFQLQVWKGASMVKDTGWMALDDLNKRTPGFVKALTFADDAGGVYAWKVRGRNHKGNGPWKVSAFKLRILDTPVFTAPAPAFTLIGGTPFTCSWNPVTHASDYQLDVLQDGNVVNSFTTPLTSWELTLASGSYTLRVTAMAEGTSRPATLGITVGE